MKYCGAVHSISNLKYNVLKNFLKDFHNGWNYDHCFIVIELAEEFKKQFIWLVENIEKHITFAIPIEKEVTRIDKNGEKITQNLSDIWSSILFLKKFVKLNVNLDMKIKNEKLVELSISIATVFLNMQTLRWFNKIQMFVS